MAERKIDPKFNIYETYTTMNILNPYRFGGGAAPSFLVSEYPMTETTGNAIDIVGGNNGILEGTIGRNGVSYEFNGSNTAVRVADNNNHSFVDANGDMPFTIEMDIKWKSLSDAWIVSRRNSGTLHQEWQLIHYQGQIYFSLFENAGSGSPLIGRKFNSSGAISLNTFYKFKATYDGSKNRTGLKIYLDDIRVDTIDDGAATYLGMSNTDAETRIGVYTSDLFRFNGFIKNLKIHKGGVA